eukprot:scaffold14371_cov40-Attheya_sp.AAC.8
MGLHSNFSFKVHSVKSQRMISCRGTSYSNQVNQASSDDTIGDECLFRPKKTLHSIICQFSQWTARQGSNIIGKTVGKFNIQSMED